MVAKFFFSICEKRARLAAIIIKAFGHFFFPDPSASQAFKPLDKHCQYRLQYVLELSAYRHFEHAYDKSPRHFSFCWCMEQVQPDVWWRCAVQEGGGQNGESQLQQPGVSQGTMSER